MAQASGPGASDELVAKARAQGVIQVIVTLRVPSDAPAATLESVKQSVLDALAGTRYRVLHALPNLPQLVLEASDEALRALGTSPHVLKIQEPRVTRPTR